VSDKTNVYDGFNDFISETRMTLGRLQVIPPPRPLILQTCYY